MSFIEAVEDRIAAIVLSFAKKAATDAPLVEVDDENLIQNLTEVDLLQGTAHVLILGKERVLPAHKVHVVSEAGNAS